MSAHIFSSGSKREASHEVHRHRRLRGHVAHCRARDKRLCFLAPRLRAGAGHRHDALSACTRCLVEDCAAGALSPSSRRDHASTWTSTAASTPQHDQSYRYFMEQQPVRPRRHRSRRAPTCPTAPEPRRRLPRARPTSRAIAAAGGIGLQLLGLGPQRPHRLQRARGLTFPKRPRTASTSPRAPSTPTPACSTPSTTCPARPTPWASAPSWPRAGDPRGRQTAPTRPRS